MDDRLNRIKAKDAKRGQWIQHYDFAEGSLQDWRISKVRYQNTGEWTLLFVLVREDLKAKAFRKDNGTWEPGRATVTNILRTTDNEEFERCDNVDENQFDWQRK